MEGEKKEDKKCPICNGELRQISDPKYVGKCKDCSTYVVKNNNGETRTYNNI